MGQVIGSENLPDLVIASTTTITMATTYLGKQTRISVGGQQYLYSSLITINFATTGINGLDTGAIAANSLYYIYSVQTSNTPGLVASLASPTTGPTGFTAWKEVARVRTLQTAATLAQIANRLGGTSFSNQTSEWIAFTPTFNNIPTIANQGSIYRRSVSSIEFMIDISALADATGTVQWNMTGGLTNITADATKISTRQNLGSGFMAGGSLNYSVSCNYSGTTGIASFRLDNEGTIDTTNPAADGGFDINDRITFTARYAVAEWAGLYT